MNYLEYESKFLDQDFFVPRKAQIEMRAPIYYVLYKLLFAPRNPEVKFLNLNCFYYNYYH